MSIKQAMALLDQYFDETDDEEIIRVFDLIESRNIHNGTLAEYFDSFSSHFKCMPDFCETIPFEQCEVTLDSKYTWTKLNKRKTIPSVPVNQLDSEMIIFSENEDSRDGYLLNYKAA